MRSIIIFLLLGFPFCPTFSQPLQRNGWTEIVDSVGVNLFDPKANYCLLTFNPFDEKMKKEIEAWLNHQNDSTWFPSGVILLKSKKNTYRRYWEKDGALGEWRKVKRSERRKQKRVEFMLFNLVVYDED